jgi:hypothetical protein
VIAGERCSIGLVMAVAGGGVRLATGYYPPTENWPRRETASRRRFIPKFANSPPYRFGDLGCRLGAGWCQVSRGEVVAFEKEGRIHALGKGRGGAIADVETGARMNTFAVMVECCNRQSPLDALAGRCGWSGKLQSNNPAQPSVTRHLEGYLA